MTAILTLEALFLQQKADQFTQRANHARRMIGQEVSHLLETPLLLQPLTPFQSEDGEQTLPEHSGYTTITLPAVQDTLLN